MNHSEALLPVSEIHSYGNSIAQYHLVQRAMVDLSMLHAWHEKEYERLWEIPCVDWFLWYMMI